MTIRIFFNIIVNLQCCVSFRCTAKWFMHICVLLHLFLDSFPIGYCRILRRRPRPFQQVLVDYLFYTQQCEFVNFKLLAQLSPLAAVRLFAKSMGQFLFLLYSFLCFIFRFYIQVILYIICLCLTYFTNHNSCQVHPCCWKQQNFHSFHG